MPWDVHSPVNHLKPLRPRSLWLVCLGALLLAVVCSAVVPSIAGGQTAAKKNILIINEVGLSHTAVSAVAQQIVSGVREKPDRHVEFYSESLDLISFPNKPSRADVRDWLVKKYGDYRLDAVVAMGPETIDFLALNTQSMFLEVPIVICASTEDQAKSPRLDSRFTGTWLKLEPQKTLELALHLFPDTRHVFVVGGSSSFDSLLVTLTKEAFRNFQATADFTYLTDMRMDRLIKRVQQLPAQSAIFYISILQDAAGNKFLNATQALPMIAEAANAPVFGMADTYVGNGIVGGDVIRFQEQARVTAQIVSELLSGKNAQDIPIETLPSSYMFDWKALQRWHVKESSLPPGSIVMFREPSFWERTKWVWTTALLIIAGLTLLVAYLLYSRKQLRLARDRQRQLSGMLIAAGEKERRRLASELHDDYSQRLALLSLGLENLGDALSPPSEEVKRQIHELANSVGELGADLHTLSHRLHSSTLERLGLVPGVSALCKEYGAQQSLDIDFSSKDIPDSVPPDIALCLFRIVQEGLRNLKKHSSVSRGTVHLRRVGDNLHVSVCDEGIGFDAETLNGRQGLGLRSMEERATLLGGRFEAHSRPGKGTRIEAWVPLQPEPRLAKD